MKTSSLPPKSGTETRTAFAAACALYFPCMALAVWGASLAPSPAVPVAGDIMLAVAHFQSEAVAAPAPAAAPESVAEPVAESEPQPEPEAVPEPEPEVMPEPEPEPEPLPEPEPEPIPDPEPPLPAPVPELKPEPKPAPKPEPVEVVKPVKKVTEARRPPEKRRMEKEKRPERPRRESPASAQPQGAPAPQTAADATAPAAAAEPELLVAGRDGDPFLGQVREAVLSTLEYPRQARRMRREGTVTVQFVISPEGRVSGIRIHEGSGHEMLDREASAAVARAASLWGQPGRTVRIRMPVVFTLRKGGAS